MLEISMIFLMIGLFSFAFGTILGLVVGFQPSMYDENFLSLSLNEPIGPVSYSISILLCVIGLSISYHFLIPVFIAMAAIGYIISIKKIPSWVLTLNDRTLEYVKESLFFPYYSTIFIMSFWPIMILFKLIKMIILPITFAIRFKIETPNAALKRAISKKEEK